MFTFLLFLAADWVDCYVVYSPFRLVGFVGVIVNMKHAWLAVSRLSSSSEATKLSKMSQSRAVGALFAVRWARSGKVVRATVGAWHLFLQGVLRSLTCARGDSVTLAKLRPVLLFNASILALCVPEIVFICCLECSNALQMSSAFSRVRSDSHSSISFAYGLVVDTAYHPVSNQTIPEVFELTCRC